MSNNEIEQEKLADSIKLVNEILSPKILKKKSFLWQDIGTSLSKISTIHTKETEEILVSLLEFEGELKLASKSDIPGLMSPEDMLKSIAIQSLTKWTGQKYLSTIKKIYKSTQSAALAEIARVSVEKVGGDLEITTNSS